MLPAQPLTAGRQLAADHRVAKEPNIKVGGDQNGATRKVNTGLSFVGRPKA